MRRGTTAVDMIVFVLLLLGLTVPGLIVLAATFAPEASGIDLEGSVSTGQGRMLLVGLAIIGIVASLGFVMKQRWAWWFVVVWTLFGFLGGMRILLFGVTGAVGPMIFPSLILIYAFLKRDEFGFGGAKSR